MQNYTRYMVLHKDIDFIPKECTPIFVGSGYNKENFLTDNTGDNISNKNRNYCELTALYWIWKNDHISKYVSIEHYRRFFMDKTCPIPKICNSSKILKHLERGQVITSPRYRFGMTIKQFYKERHYECDMEAAKAGIEKFYPDCLSVFQKIMAGNSIPMFNMVAMKKKDFDDYCEWLFRILFYVEKSVDLTERTEFQKRAFGFLSERLLEVWIEYRCHNVYRMPIYYRKSNFLVSELASIKHRIPITYTPNKPRW